MYPTLADPDSDESVALRAASGSHPDFAVLVKRFQGPLFRFILSRVRRAEEAEDIAQQCFVQAWKHLPRWRPEARFSTWLYTIAHRAALNQLRRAVPLPLEEAPEPSTNHHAGNDCERADNSSQIWDLARSELPANQHEALWLFYGEDLSVEEIAALTGTGKSLVKIRLFRARIKLKSLIARLDRRTATSALLRFTTPSRP